MTNAYDDPRGLASILAAAAESNPTSVLVGSKVLAAAAAALIQGSVAQSLLATLATAAVMGGYADVVEGDDEGWVVIDVGSTADLEEAALLRGLLDQARLVLTAQETIAKATTPQPRVRPGQGIVPPITPEMLAEARKVIDSGGTYSIPTGSFDPRHGPGVRLEDGIAKAARENDPEMFNVGPVLNPQSFVGITLPSAGEAAPRPTAQDLLANLEESVEAAKRAKETKAENEATWNHDIHARIWPPVQETK